MPALTQKWTTRVIKNAMEGQRIKNAMEGQLQHWPRLLEPRQASQGWETTCWRNLQQRQETWIKNIEHRKETWLKKYHPISGETKIQPVLSNWLAQLLHQLQLKERQDFQNPGHNYSLYLASRNRNRFESLIITWWAMLCTVTRWQAEGSLVTTVCRNAL